MIWFQFTCRAQLLLTPPDERQSDRLTIEKLQAIAVQVLATAIAAMILIPDDSKKEAAGGLFLAAFIGAAITEAFVKTEPIGAWYWAAPILVGTVGYLVNALTDATSGIGATGRLIGTFAALVRPIPLDYASFGVLGALFGYWMTAEQEPLRRAAGTRAPSLMALLQVKPTSADTSPTDAEAKPSDNGRKA